MRYIIIGLMAAVNTPLAAAELTVCYAVLESRSLGPIFLQEPLRCVTAHKAEDRGLLADDLFRTAPCHLLIQKHLGGAKYPA